MGKGAVETREKTKSTEERASLSIRGMTCAACANRIEKGLAKLPGVSDANVNFAMEKASVRFDPAQIDLDQMAAKVRDLGYDVTKEKTKLSLVGMTCANCASRIERGLNKMPGVTATVNFGAESALVEYVPSLTSVEDLKRKVADLGYEAFVADEGGGDAEKEAREAEIGRQKFLFVLSAVLSFPSWRRC